MQSSLFKRYLLSSLIFKSVLIGGGYATGRELVEFFLSRGPATGFAAMLVVAAIFSGLLVVVFELARRYQLYDYRSFLKKLLGPGWVLYEIAFLALLVLILSVLGAAAGEIVAKQFAVAKVLGTAMQMTVVAVLVFFGTRAVERFFTAWGVVLYAAFALFFAWSAVVLGPDILHRWEASSLSAGAVSAGLTYAGYNMAVIPTMLYCARHFERTRDAVVSGIVAGPIAMVPALLFFFALVSRYPEVNEQHVPIVYMLEQLHASMFNIAFQGVVFGTLIEAGAALIHGFNERIADMVQERGHDLPGWARAVIALGLMLVSMLLANRVGIVDLIAKGYGYSTYVFLALIAVPVLTRGLWLILRKPTLQNVTVA